jgi:hypothetical protein
MKRWVLRLALAAPHAEAARSKPPRPAPRRRPAYLPVLFLRPPDALTVRLVQAGPRRRLRAPPGRRRGRPAAWLLSAYSGVDGFEQSAHAGQRLRSAYQSGSLPLSGGRSRR